MQYFAYFLPLGGTVLLCNTAWGPENCELYSVPLICCFIVM